MPMQCHTPELTNMDIPSHHTYTPTHLHITIPPYTFPRHNPFPAASPTTSSHHYITFPHINSSRIQPHHHMYTPYVHHTDAQSRPVAELCH